MKINFIKYHGTGNDFILIDNRSKNYFLKNNQIKFLCDRKYGIGADGLILLNSSKNQDFEMSYFNADGNKSTMCGNGGRCIVDFARYLNIIESETTFLACDGVHVAKILNKSKISLSMSNIINIEKKSNDIFIDSGSPHKIIQTNNIEDIDVFNLGKKHRNLLEYQPDGVNINFVQKISNDTFKIRTYERGVENETLSCGTGAVACAIAMHYSEQTKKNKILIKTLGGDLIITFDSQFRKSYCNIYLEGEVKIAFKGNIEII